jgi:capsular polysaccharide transport system permease protein
MPSSPTALYAERATLPELPPPPSLWESLRIQLRVIGALIIRETLTRYGRHNIGFLWLFVEPMIFTLGITIIWSAAGLKKGGGLSITEFMLAGYSTLLLWRNMPNRCLMALAPNYDLLFHRQVKPLDVLLSRCLLEAAGASMSFIVLGYLFYAIGIVRPPDDIFQVAVGWFLLIWYAVAVSLLVGAVSERSEVLDRVWHIVQYLMIPLSGSLFMVDMFSGSVREALLWIPTVSCNELIREGYFGPSVPSHYDLGYVAIFNTCMLLVALIQLRIVSRTISPAS